MNGIDSLLRGLWRSLPGRERLRRTKTFVALRGAYYSWRWRGASHDQIFDRSYFEFVERTTSTSAEVIADSILTDYQPESVLDVGCGTGTLLERLRERGVRVRGVERAAAGLEFCRERGLDVAAFDVCHDALSEADRADVAVCMEVAHQLPRTAADTLVDLLCAAAPIVVFSSETPGGGDRCASNEQPPEYWIEKFRARGFAWEAERTTAWRLSWEASGVKSWFCKNLLLFRRSEK